MKIQSEEEMKNLIAFFELLQKIDKSLKKLSPKQKEENKIKLDKDTYY